MVISSLKTHSGIVDSPISVNLGPVQETLLIPLLGRARETLKARGLLQDMKSVEISRQLDYDFSKWNKSKSLVGACYRTLMFDHYVEQFLSEHPGGTVVEIGCGLNTRFERIDNGQAHWFDLDLPDVISLRREFFGDAPRRTMIEASVLSCEWMERVKATGGPWIFVSEAALIYLRREDAQKAIVQIAQAFPGAYFAFDTTDRKMVWSQDKHDAMQHLPKESWFRWACDDPKEVEKWGVGLKLLDSKTFLDADHDLVGKLPFLLQFMVRYLPGVMRASVAGYRLNLARSST